MKFKPLFNKILWKDKFMQSADILTKMETCPIYLAGMNLLEKILQNREDILISS